MDNLTGFSQAIAACYPQTEIQKCIIHQIRNSTRFVSYKDLKKVTAALKPIYKAATEEADLVELDRFEEEWGTKYPLAKQVWLRAESEGRFSDNFFDFVPGKPVEVEFQHRAPGQASSVPAAAGVVTATSMKDYLA